MSATSPSRTDIMFCFVIVAALFCICYRDSWPAAALGPALLVATWVGRWTPSHRSALAVSGGSLAMLGHALSGTAHPRFAPLASMCAGACALLAAWACTDLARPPEARHYWPILALCLLVGLTSGSLASEQEMVRSFRVLGFGGDWVATYAGPIRKVAHAAFYGMVGGATFYLIRSGTDWRRPAIAALLLALAAGASDEIRQMATRSRTASPTDVLLDFTGAAIVVALMVIVQRHRQTIGHESP